MQAPTMTSATLDDLYRVEGNAELIGGRIVQLMPSGGLPSLAAFEIAVSLRAHAKRIGKGIAFGDGVGFALAHPLPNGRQSFSPDAAYHLGPRVSMRFVDGAPVFAVEVRSEGDYGPAAELEISEKRADYFLAGTLVVWDVDPMARTVTAYRSSNPHQPAIYRAGQTAEGEPAVPGWRMPVDEIFS